MATKDHRRELRLSSSDDDLISQAAGLLGLSVSEFLLNRAVADAEAIVAAHRTVPFQRDSYDRFLATLDVPAHPVTELVEQIRKSRALKHADGDEHGRIIMRIDEAIASFEAANRND